MSESRTIVVTGGGKGIGRAAALRFAATGDRVVICGRDRAALDETAGLADGAIETVPCDVTDEDAVTALFADRDVDVLVANAGISMAAPAHKHTLAQWNDMLAVNATGAFLCTRAVLPGMTARDRGRVVYVASTSGLYGFRYTAGYTASKHAMIGLMRGVAAEVAGTGVTANAVCPGYADTEMTERSIANIVAKTGRSAGEAESAITDLSPLGRLIAPEEVAAAIEYLASDAAAPINGQTVVLDGGGVQS